MIVLNVLLPSLVAVLAGGCIGAVFGFTIAANRDVMLGYRPNTTNKFLLFICRPTREFSALEAIGLFAVVVGWLALFVALCGAPIMVASRLVSPDSPVVSIVLAVFFVAAYFARHLGRNLWLRLV